VGLMTGTGENLRRLHERYSDPLLTAVTIMIADPIVCGGVPAGFAARTLRLPAMTA
jgi:hypothetical protein